MTKKMTRAEAKAFKARWARVNAFEIEELRTTSYDVRLQQFMTMMQWVRQFGWHEGLSEGEDEVRRRWATLRKAKRA
jgi:hypothetical protein